MSMRILIVRLEEAVGKVGVNHFNARTIKSLQRRGIQIIGITAIPANAHDRSYTETGYELDDNGTHRIKTYLQVLAIADAAPKA